MRRQYKLTKDRFEHKAGTVAHEFTGRDYGCKTADELDTGFVHLLLTVNADGSGPFFTIPVTDVEEIK